LAGEAGGCRADEPGEVAVQVGLVVETDRGRDVGDGLPGQQTPARGLDAPSGEVAVRRQAERRGEAPDQVRGVGVQHVRGGAEGEPRDEVGVEQVPQVCGEAVGRWRGLRAAEVDPEAVADQREAALRGQRLRQAGVQLGDPDPQQVVGQARPGDRGGGEAFVED
jgi:hypothetical protein